jgi:hypothetical protein
MRRTLQRSQQHKILRQDILLVEFGKKEGPFEPDQGLIEEHLVNPPVSHFEVDLNIRPQRLRQDVKVVDRKGGCSFIGFEGFSNPKVHPSIRDLK